MLSCGVSQGLPGFSAPDDKGNWTGLDVDFCRAVAAAIFNDPTKVKFVPLSAKERFTALQSGEIDVLSRNTTWTMTRDTSLGLNFAGVNYYDGQGFMVRKSLKVEFGARAGRRHGLRPDRHHHRAEPRRLLQGQQHEVRGGRVREPPTKSSRPMTPAAATSSRPTSRGLYAERLKLAKPDDHVMLPEIISKEPLGPVVRQGDDQWFDIVKWTCIAHAQRRGTRHHPEANVDEMRSRTNPDIQARCSAPNGNFGETARPDQGLGCRASSRHVGNYGEIFERNVGAGSPLRIARGLNALWNKGGLQYAPPIR